MTDIILASASPRRAELLTQIGISYQVQAVDIDESSLPNETPEALVLRLAKEKSLAITCAVNSAENSAVNNTLNTQKPVLGSDTLGSLDGEILVKPENYDHAHTMLTSMSGRWHEILTAVAITHAGETAVKLNRNRVLFRQLSDAEILAYWQTGEPQDKAGAYAIQGLGATFIECIEGSYSGIMGLPLFETSQLLQQFGISVLNLKP